MWIISKKDLASRNLELQIQVTQMFSNLPSNLIVKLQKMMTPNQLLSNRSKKIQLKRKNKLLKQRLRENKEIHQQRSKSKGGRVEIKGFLNKIPGKPKGFNSKVFRIQMFSEKTQISKKKNLLFFEDNRHNKSLRLLSQSSKSMKREKHLWEP